MLKMYKVTDPTSEIIGDDFIGDTLPAQMSESAVKTFVPKLSDAKLHFMTHASNVSNTESSSSLPQQYNSNLGSVTRGPNQKFVS